MTNTLNLVQRIAAIAFCVCFIHGVDYSQTISTASPQEIVRLRTKIAVGDLGLVEFSSASKLLAVAQGDGSVRIIDITDGREQAVLPVSGKEKVLGMEWTSDGQRLLVVSSKSAALWDARRGTKLSVPIATREGNYLLGLDDVKLSPDEKLLLSLKENGGFKATLLEKDNATVRVWDLESGAMRFEVKINGLEGRAQFSPDSKLLLTSSATEDPRLWDVKTGHLFVALKPVEHVFLCGAAVPQFSPDGRFVVVQYPRCGTCIWDRTMGVIRNTIWLDKDDIGGAFWGFTPDGKMFVIAHQRRKGWGVVMSVQLRDCETGELRSSLTAEKWEDLPEFILWSNDGRTFVATSGYKYKGRIWDVSTGRLKATIPLVLTYSRIPFDWGYKDRDKLSLHPTLPIVTAASSKFVRLWNADTGELMQTLENTGRMGEWSADGKLLLTSSKDFTFVFVWDVVRKENS